MANSKSNIYPIQLQGAELNLNKYDAEIKQYSGFNKNNSPFVGGCLSNIFTKNQTIEGGNDDNVYIDTNGDIYKIIGNNFYKNENVLTTFRNDTLKIECNEIKDIDFDFIFSDKIKIKVQMVNNFPNYHFIGTDINIKFSKDISFDDCLQNGFFTGYELPTSANLFFFLCYTLGNNQNNIDERLYIFNATSGSYINDILIRTFSSSNLSNDLSAPKLRIINIHDNAILINRIDYLGVQSNRTERYNYIKYNPASGEIIENHIITGIYADDINSQLYPIENYRIAENRSVFFIGNNGITESLSSGYMQFIYNVPISNQITVIDSNYYLNVNSNSSRSLKINFPFSSEVSFPFFENRIATANVKIAKDNYFMFRHIDSTAVRNYGFYVRQNDNTDLSGEFVLGDTVQWLNVAFSALINNGALSGVACDKTLVTNWNNVEIYNIFCNGKEQKLYYKENGKWFSLYRVNTIKMKKIGDWLVFNVPGRNAYNIIKNIFGYYASSFNLNIKTPTQTSFTINSFYSISIAAAINEYDRESLPSIILNPVRISFRNDYNSSNDNQYSMSNPNVDLFKSKNEQGEPIYFKSTNCVKDALKDLPYPSTDGLIEYNPCLFSEIKSIFGDSVFIKSGNTLYPLMKDGSGEVIMSSYMTSGISNIDVSFIIQGQYYGIINKGIYAFNYNNGVVTGISFIVSVENLLFVGNTPYEALFFSNTNRCLYSFTGSNVLSTRQLVDKINEVRKYIYNPATQTVFLITNIGVFFYGIFGQFLLEKTNISNIFLLDDGIVFSSNDGNYMYVKYYLNNSNDDFEKENIKLETCFYGMDNQTVTVNDCLYIRLFSEEHEEGEVIISATTISLEGRQTDETVFRFSANDWDAKTHTIYLRYQPKYQKGLGISFSINSPFKIASLSVGSRPDAILVDKASKGAINAPYNNNSSIIKW